MVILIYDAPCPPVFTVEIFLGSIPSSAAGDRRQPPLDELRCEIEVDLVD